MVFKDKLVIAKEGLIYLEKNNNDDLILLNNENILEHIFLVVTENNDLILNDLFKMLKKYPNLLSLGSNFKFIMEEYDKISENDEIVVSPVIDRLLIEKHIIKNDDSLEIFKGITTVNESDPEDIYCIYFEFLKDIINYDINIGNIILSNNNELVNYEYYDLTLSELLGIMLLDFSYAGGLENKKIIKESALNVINQENKKSGFKLVKK